jgi:hypothetical protein
LNSLRKAQVRANGENHEDGEESLHRCTLTFVSSAR